MRCADSQNATALVSPPESTAVKAASGDSFVKGERLGLQIRVRVCGLECLEKVSHRVLDGSRVTRPLVDEDEVAVEDLVAWGRAQADSDHAERFVDIAVVEMQRSQH